MTRLEARSAERHDAVAGVETAGWSQGERSAGRSSRVERAAPVSDHSAQWPRRLRSLDAIRGLAIVIMLLNANPFPRTHLWDQLTHPEWHGLHFADLFFPLFLFAMGAAMTLSTKTGSPRMVMRRVTILFLLGVALTSLKHGHLASAGVLQHIAIAYLVGWLVLLLPRKVHAAVAAALLTITWGLFVGWVAPGADPWSQDGTFAHSVNRAITGGFSTEGFVQSVVSAFNVIAGALVARGMKERETGPLVRWIGGHSAWLLLLALGLALLIPINKKLWTPSFAVLSTATSMMWLAFFVWVADIRRWRWSKPLEQLGANPIAVYVVFMTATLVLARWRGVWPQFALFGSQTLGQLMYGLVWVGLGLFFARWLYRRGTFVKI